MALIVEDGTGLSTAQAYCSVATAGAYHSAIGNTGWTGTDAAKEKALVRATQYLDTEYTYLGQRAYDSVQALQWPRTNMPDRCYFESRWPPKRLQDACAELALRALSGELYADQVDAQVVEEEVGPLRVKYAPGRHGGQQRYAVVDRLLAPFLGAGRLSGRMERAS